MDRSQEPSRPRCSSRRAPGWPADGTRPLPARRTLARLVLLLALALVALPLLPGPEEARASGHEVVVARVSGVVDRGTAIYLEDALEEAERRNAPLVIELDTPGGLVDATLDIDRDLADASVPVLTYVGPGGGAFAASAGTFLLLMGQPNGMADGASIGSAQPIQVGPGGGQQNASAKVENFLVERIRSIAERTGRDPGIAERYVTENLNQNATVAVRTGMVDVQGDTLEAFLDAVDGRSARIGGGGQTVLRTADAQVVRVDPGLLPNTVSILSNPTLASIFLLVGVYTLIFGLANPGTYIPETIGAILLLLGLIGLGLFGVTTAGILLMLLAAAFLVAEVFTPTHGILTVVGVVALILGIVFLLDDPLLPRGFVRQFQFIGYGFAVITGLIVFAMVTVAMRSRKRPVEDRSIGDKGRAMDRLDPDGTVEVWGEVWEATADDGPIEAGERVRVAKRDGLRLTVRRVPTLDEEE